MLLRIVFIIGMTASSFFSQNIMAQTITAEDIYDDLIYADLVVEGEIVDMTNISIPLGDYFPSRPNDFKLPYKNIKFKVDRTLIGDCNDDIVSVMALISYGGEYNFDLEKGERYILALKLHPGGKGVFLKKQYLLLSDSTRFLLYGDMYSRGSKNNPIGNGEISDLIISIDKINKLRSIKTLTHESEIVIRGDVIETSIYTELSQTGEEIVWQEISLRINRLLKGDYDKDTLIVRMIRRGGYNPEWRVKVPYVHEGEEWYMFLKWNQEPGYYPYAGVNGMFRIEGERIIRDNLNTNYLSVDKYSFEKNIVDEVEIRERPNERE